jgi:methionyl-tRNA synthetase
VHVIGKDILIPAHGVYWPIMLKSLGFADDEIPTLLVHGWWNISGAKMSKSLGNVVDPDVLVDIWRAAVEKELAKQKAKNLEKGKPALSDEEILSVSTRCGAEAVRYYLVGDISTGKDADFSEERLVQRFNTDLANNIGNLLNRSVSMATSYRAGKVRPVSISGSAAEGLAAKVAPVLESYRSAMTAFQVANALNAISDLAVAANGAIETAAPFKLAKAEKDGDAEAGKTVDATLYALAESLRIVAILLSPVLPKASHGIFDQLNWKMELSGKDERFRLADAVWGGLPDGHQLGQPTPLFPRIEMPAAE